MMRTSSTEQLAVEGRRTILSERIIHEMTLDRTVSKGLRGLGWDKRTGYSTNRGNRMSAAAFGHGGFTGTVLWIDPELDLFFIFLSNRVHPDGKGSVNQLAGSIADIIVSAIPDR
jgi:CubicO group peptidase (beta-lactamase class C family)